VLAKDNGQPRTVDAGADRGENHKDRGKPMNPIAEPNFETAAQWWPEMPNKWAPIGWKDHLLRFNVLWSGAILAKPNLNRRTSQYEGQGAQFTFVPTMKPA
jgi:hypothetical protein